MLNDRIAEVDARFEEATSAIAALEQNLESVDVEAIDEMKDQVSSAVGEVDARAHRDRAVPGVDGRVDGQDRRSDSSKSRRRLQDQHIDVETAVQLERLEEVERALIALDPSQFVRRVDRRSRDTRSRSDQSDGSDGSDRVESTPVIGRRSPTPTDHDAEQARCRAHATSRRQRCPQ